MKKLFLLLAALAVLVGCANNQSSKKPQAPAEESVPVEAEAEPASEPAQLLVQPQARQTVKEPVQPVEQPEESVEAEVEQPQESAPEVGEEAAPVQEAVVTVDALCQQFGVYELFTQFDRFLKDGDKKSARKIEGQLSQLKKQVKANSALPEKLRESFKNYIEDKQEEIGARYK